MAVVSPLSGLAVINYVNNQDTTALTALLKATGCQVFELNGTGVRDKKSLFEAVTNQLLKRNQIKNWADFNDSSRNLLWETKTPFMALVWRDAGQMLKGGLADLVTALDNCTQIARELYAKDIIFVVFLLGDDANFPPLDSR